MKRAAEDQTFFYKFHVDVENKVKTSTREKAYHSNGMQSIGTA